MTNEEKKIEEALIMLVHQLENSSVRKFSCINTFGFSQLERDIVSSQKEYWQKGMYTEEEVRLMCSEIYYQGANDQLELPENHDNGDHNKSIED